MVRLHRAQELLRNHHGDSSFKMSGWTWTWKWSGGAGGSKASRKSGRGENCWYCSAEGCGNWNYARRTVCFTCGANRADGGAKSPPSSSGGSEAESAGAFSDQELQKLAKATEEQWATMRALLPERLVETVEASRGREDEMEEDEEEPSARERLREAQRVENVAEGKITKWEKCKIAAVEKQAAAKKEEEDADEELRKWRAELKKSQRDVLRLTAETRFGPEDADTGMADRMLKPLVEELDSLNLGDSEEAATIRRGMAEMQAAAGKLHQLLLQEREKARAKEDELAEQAKRDQEEERAKVAAANAESQAAPRTNGEQQEGSPSQIPGLNVVADVVGAAGGYDLQSAVGVVHAALAAGGQAARKQLVATLADPGAEAQSMVASILGKSPGPSNKGTAAKPPPGGKKGGGSDSTTQGKGVKKAKGR